MKNIRKFRTAGKVSRIEDMPEGKGYPAGFLLWSDEAKQQYLRDHPNVQYNEDRIAEQEAERKATEKEAEVKRRMPKAIYTGPNGEHNPLFALRDADVLATGLVYGKLAAQRLRQLYNDLESAEAKEALKAGLFSAVPIFSAASPLLGAIGNAGMAAYSAYNLPNLVETAYNGFNNGNYWQGALGTFGATTDLLGLGGGMYGLKSFRESPEFYQLTINNSNPKVAQGFRRLLDYKHNLEDYDWFTRHPYTELNMTNYKVYQDYPENYKMDGSYYGDPGGTTTAVFSNYDFEEMPRIRATAPIRYTTKGDKVVAMAGMDEPSMHINLLPGGYNKTLDRGLALTAAKIREEAPVGTQFSATNIPTLGYQATKSPTPLRFIKEHKIQTDSRYNDPIEVDGEYSIDSWLTSLKQGGQKGYSLRYANPEEYHNFNKLGASPLAKYFRKNYGEDDAYIDSENFSDADIAELNKAILAKNPRARIISRRPNGTLDVPYPIAMKGNSGNALLGLIEAIK